MNTNGNHSIYFLDIFDSFGATLAAYLFGIVAVLCMGFLVGVFIDWLSNEKQKQPFENDTLNTAN